MRELILIDWRPNLFGLLPVLVLAAWAANAGDAGMMGALLAVAVTTGVLRWISSPGRVATEDFLLVRGIATRRGLALRRLLVGLAPTATVLATIAALRAVGWAEPGQSLARLTVAAVDLHLIVAALTRRVRLESPFATLALTFGVLATFLALTSVVAFERDAILAIVTLVGSPLALASLLGAPFEERSAGRDRPSPGDTSAREGRPPSPPLRALARVALRPALGRDPTATFYFVLTAHLTASALALAPFLTSEPKLLSIGGLVVGMVLVMTGIVWFMVGVAGARQRPAAWRGQLEWLLARPLSRGTLAAGAALSVHLALLGIVAIGFGAATAYAASRGQPTPRAIAALAFFLLASAEFGVTALGVCSAARSRRGVASVAFMLVPFALPLLLALPQLERGARGESAVLAPWAFATGAPWIAAHAPIALLALLAATALAHALAYRSFRSYEL